MKKFSPAVGLILITLLFFGCSVDDPNVDTSVLAQVQGKWKLTQYVNDTPFILNYLDGPVMELKADGTFTSNEEPGYSSGTYTVIKSPGTNLRLVYQKQWSAKLVYKRIDAVDATSLQTQTSINKPMSDETASFEGYGWIRIP